MLLLLLSLLLLVVILHLFSAYGESQFEGQGEAPHESDEISLFLASVGEKRAEKEQAKVHLKWKQREITPTRFDPNSVDSLQLYEMGLPIWLISRILNYRKAGGKFPTPEAFGRIYGLSETLFAELKPFIEISDSFLPFKRKVALGDSLALEKAADSLRYFKYPEGVLVDLNSADTTELKKIPGIGSAIARMVVVYRERLGGFYSVRQLEEIAYLSTDLWKWFVVKESPIPFLDVNVASLDRLRAHPYLNFYQAKVIVEHRKKRGKIESLSQLSLYEEFAEKDFDRLTYYLKFD
ncbi:MAG: helix-hairpin-helix domain-containing protein [Phocaeicola sp.]